MNYFLDLVYNLVMSPRMALRTITGGEQWISAGIIWLFTLFVLSLSSLIEGTGIILGFLLSLIVGITLLLLQSAIIHYVAGLAGGRGTARGITAGLMADSFPLAFGVFASLISKLGGEALAGAIMMVALAWCFVLNVLTVSENYGMSWGRSVLILVVPAVLVGAVVMGLIGIVTVMGVTAIMSMGL